MTPEVLGFILMACLLVSLFVGFPIAFTLISLSVFFGYLGIGDRIFHLMVFQTWGLMKEETLAAVPLFIFMGYMLQYAGLVERFFRGFQFLLASVRGSLYLGVLVTATIFAMATGIMGASVTLMGIMAGSAMRKSNYDPAMSAGVITAGGALGILIPPSVMLVVMAPVLGVSILKLFAAAIIPGFLLSALYIAYAMVRSFLNPSLGPPLPPEERARNIWVALRELLLGMIPMAFLILSVLGSILAGLATPTEASAMGAIGSLLLVLAYRRFTFSRLLEAMRGTIVTSCLILFLAVAASIFGATFTRLGSASAMANFMLGIDVAPLIMVLILLVTLFLLGWPLEWPAIVFIFLPVMAPVVLGLDLGGDLADRGDKMVWFATLAAVNMQTTFLSPPVAMAAYYLRAVVPQWTLGQIYWGMLQFMVLQLIGLLVVLFYPPIALWLPNLLFGR